MRQLKLWWLSLPVAAIVALAAWFAAKQDGAVVPEARTPEIRRDAERPSPAAIAFRATRDGERLLLSGAVPPGDARKALLEEARAAVVNATVRDELKEAVAVPPGFAEAAVLATRQLARLPSAVTSVENGAVSVAGQAPDVESYQAIVAALAKPPEGYRSDLAALVPPPVRPYTWSASVGENEIVLAGHVPSESARQDVRTAASRAFPDKRLVDGLQPGSGLPADLDFPAAIRFALAQLGQLRAGSADLVDGTLTLRGDVTDRDTLAGIRAAMQSGLPPGLRPGSIAVAVRAPSPYAFSARREAGTLILTGYYPDQAARTAIGTLIRERFFSEQVVDKLRPAEGAPKGYVAGVSFGLEHLSRLASGEVVVRNTSMEVRGEALYEQTAEQTARAVRGVSLPGWTGRAEVRLRSSEKASVEP